MPKRISADELQTVLDAVSDVAHGASIQDLVDDTALELPRRTLQRRLAQLVADGRMVRTGAGRGIRYRLATGDVTVEPVTGRLRFTGLAPEVETYVPISPAAEQVKAAVRAPITERAPVGYNPTFLDDYRPNETFFLSAETRTRLQEKSQTPGTPKRAGTFATNIYQRLLVDLSFNSSRLEGNTYSLLETERLLAFGEAAAGRDAREAQMILNHKAAIDLLVEHPEDIGFDRHTILNLHALLADNLLADPSAGGRLRTRGVTIAGTSYHPLEMPQLIEEQFDALLDTAAQIEDPFEQAFFAIVQLPYLQPFEDVNKRVSRLAANLPLIRHDLCPISFVDVPARAYIDGLLGVYELNRVELAADVFCWAYERSCARYAAIRQSLGEPDPFRFRYRERIADSVRAIVERAMDRPGATAHIRGRAADDMSADERMRFLECVETELISLHEGNIARFHLTPDTYRRWQERWRQDEC